jgi:hypothetical protein
MYCVDVSQDLTINPVQVPSLRTRQALSGVPHEEGPEKQGEPKAKA